MGLPEIRRHLAQILGDLDTVIAAQTPTFRLVQPGDNLPSLVADGPAGAAYSLAAEYDFGVPDWAISKPCTILQMQDVGPGRVLADVGGPILRGQLQILAPDVTLSGFRLVGTNRDRNLIENRGAHFTLDRMLISGSPQGQRRGVYVGAPNFTVTRSHIGNIWYPGNADTQAIGLARGAVGVLVEDCFLEAAGENVMAGGGDLVHEAEMPQDIQIRHSHLFKPLAWRSTPGMVKNLFELKAAKRVTMQHCLLEQCWADAQTGFGIVLTVRNQNNLDPFATIQDVLIEDCILRGVGSAVQILGRDNAVTNGVLHPSVPMARVTFKNLTIEDLSRQTYGGGGRTFQIGGGPQDLTLDGVTVTKGAGSNPVNAAFNFGGVPCERLIVRHSRFEEGEYGVHGDGTGLGVAALEQYAPGYEWSDNTVVKGGFRTIVYPAGTQLVQG